MSSINNMNNLNYINNQVRRGQPYSQLPPYFDLPQVLIDEPYGKSWPTSLPDPFQDNLPFVDDTGRRIITQNNHRLNFNMPIQRNDGQRSLFYEPQQPRRVAPIDLRRNNVMREYYGDDDNAKKYVMSPEMYIIRDIMAKKDSTIMLLVGLAVLEGFIILHMAKTKA